MHIRIPGCGEGKLVPGDLYTTTGQRSAVTITVNGKSIIGKWEKGYAVLQRNWKKGNVVKVDLPMQPERVYAQEKVKADTGWFALIAWRKTFWLGGMHLCRYNIKSAARPQPAPTIAYNSTVTASIQSKSLMAVHDQFEPVDSKDNTVPYFHWWPKKNTTEWVQYEFNGEHTVSLCKVYWYDDGPWGGCRIPASWTIYYRKGGWVPVKNTTAYELAKDKYNTVLFEPVTTTALKIEVQLPPEYASGIHEWEVIP